MRKTFTLLFATLMSFGLFAQDLQFIDELQNSTVGSENVVIVSAPIYLQNNSEENVTVRWTRNSDGLLAGWDSQVCDPNICWGVDVSMQEFILGAGEEGSIKAQVTPNGITGEGEVKISVYYINTDGDWEFLGELDFDIIADQQLDVEDLDAESKVFNLYPNPVRTSVNLELVNYFEAQTVEIYNLVGKKVKTVELMKSDGVTTIATYDLSEGMYMLSILDADMQPLETKRFSKVR